MYPVLSRIRDLALLLKLFDALLQDFHAPAFRV